jgi:hypothetical protein
MILLFRVTVFSGCRHHGAPEITATAARALAGFGNGLVESSNGFADSEIRYLSQWLKIISNPPSPISGLILRSLPPGPREARPDDKLRKRLEGWTQRMDSRPSFETRGKARSSG